MILVEVSFRTENNFQMKTYSHFPKRGRIGKPCYFRFKS